MPPQDKKAPDPKDFLLPKKEAPGSTPDTAQRINAAQLVAQEQNAAQEGLKSGPANGLVEATETPTRGPLTDQVSVPTSPAPTPAPQEEKTSTHSLQTYKGDIEKVVEDKNVSVVNIAAAEAARRGEQPLDAQAAAAKLAQWKSWGMYAGAALLVAAPVALIAFLVLRNPALPPAQELRAPFLQVDNYRSITIPTEMQRDALNTELSRARKDSTLSLGLVDWIYLARPATEGAAAQPLTTLEFLSTLTPNVPDSLQRTLQATFLLGLHSFDENQAFLLLQADSYTTAYAGMLQWERTLRGDLGPLFVRTPSPAQAPQVPVGTTTASSTPAPEPAFIQTGFVDRIVENRDVRAVVNAEGEYLLMWTMLGRNIILITTNEYTLREVVSRINVAPTIPQPGQ